MGWLWAVFTVVAAGGQTLRNAMQRELITTLGTVGATQVRFLFGLPFALLFLLAALATTGEPFPRLTPAMLAWTLAGASSQIAATALLLMAMRDKSFVLVTSLIKIEPVHVALFGLLFLGDRLSVPLVVAIIIATTGVVIMSWPKQLDAVMSSGGFKPIVHGLLSGAMFAISAVTYRGGILSLDSHYFMVNVTASLVTGLTMQVVAISLYLLLFDRKTMLAIVRAWRPSLLAGFLGGFASLMWAAALALETAAKVRTLALVEILFAGIVSRSLFKQNLASRDGLGILLIVIGVALLLWPELLLRRFGF